MMTVDGCATASTHQASTHQRIPIMPGQVPPVPDERTGLLAFLAQQRDVIKLTAYGLSDDEARLTPEREPVERRRSRQARGDHRARVDRPGGAARPGHDPRRLRGELPPPTRRDARGGVRPLRRDRGAKPRPSSPRSPTSARTCRSRRVSRGIPTTSTPGRCGGCCLHLIAETARHAGHADIVRESIDGATAFPLMAAAEGWPATEWLQPWEKPISA